MNKIYRVVWNQAFGIWQAVAESAHGRGRTRSTRRSASRGNRAAIAALALLAAGPALAVPAVFFDGVVSSGITNFENVVTTANTSSGRTVNIFTYDLANSGSNFTVTSGGTTVYVQASRGGSPVSFDANGLDNWSVSTSTGAGWQNAIDGGFRLDFYSDASYLNPFFVNAVGVTVNNWGTCCTGSNVIPDGSAAAGSAIYSVFDPDGAQSTNLIGNITDSAARGDTDGDDNHFVAAIDDSNSFSSVVITPNGDGEAFGAGGVLKFSFVDIGSVPAGSSVVTVGVTTPDIDTAKGSYTTTELGNSTVHPVFDGGTLLVDASGTYSQNLSIKATGGTIDTAAYSATFSGVISDNGGSPGALTKTGSGTLTLTGANTYTGATSINAGTLALSGSGSLASTSITIASGATLNDGNGGLSSSADVTANGTFTLGANETIHQLGGSGTVGLGSNTLTVTQGTFSGGIGGSGALTKANAGTLTLTGANTYTGATSIDAGTLALSGGGSLASTSITIASGATLNDGNGGLSSSSAVTANGTFTLGADETINQLGGSGTVTLGSNTLTVTQGTFSGGIGGSGALTKANAGTLTLSGTNTYAGGTTINGGVLAVSADANLGNAAGGITMNGGTLGSTGSFTTARSTLLAGTGTFDTSTGTTLIDNGAVSGTGALVKDGAGTLQLCGSVSHTGGTTVSAGRLELCGNNTSTGAIGVTAGATLAVTGTTSLDSSSGVNNAGTLDISGTTAGTTAQTVSGNGDILLGSRTLTLSNASGTVGGVISGTGGLTVSGGSQTLTGANTYSGATTIDSGATLALSGSGAIGSSSGVVSNGTFSISAASGDVGVRALTGSGAVVLGANTLTLTDASGSFDGVISGDGGLAVTGGTQVLGGSNTYAGGTSIRNGATVEVAADDGLGAASGAVALDDGALHTTASFTTARDFVLTGTGSIDTATGTTLTGNGAVSGTGALDKLGAGTLQLCGDVSHSGGTRVTAGQLDLCGTYSGTGAVNVASGATLALTGATSIASASSLTSDGTFDISGTTLGATVRTLSGSGSVNLGTRNLTLSDASGDFGGVIGGSGGLEVTGGTQTLSGANTYTGATSISSGATLALTGSGMAGTSSTMVNDGSFDISGTTGGAELAALVGSGNVALGSRTLTLSNASGTYSGSIAGTGGLNVSGGIATLSGSSTYSGGTVIGSGATVRVSDDANLGAAGGGVTLDGGTLQATASFDMARDISVTGNGTVHANTGTTLTNSGAVSGTGTLIKSGAGTVELGGVLSHGGGTVVNGGVLELSGTNTYGGGTTINGGTLKVVSDANLGDTSGGVTLNGGTLQAASSFTSARDIAASSDSTVLTDAGATVTLTGALSGSGKLNKTGAGTLVLDGENAGVARVEGTGWTGGMTVESGLVLVTNPYGLGWGNVVVSGGEVNTTVDIETNQTISLAGSTVVNVDSGTSTTLTGTITDGGGSGCFVKSGQGMLRIAGTMTQSNGTCVQQGELRVNGELDSVVTVDAAGTLRGTGTVVGAMTVAGTLAPGNSPGTLIQVGTVTMLGGATFQADINGLGTGAGPGNYSRLLVQGVGSQFIAGGATLAPNLTAITGADVYTPYVPQMGDTFRIITADGGIVGRFAPLAQPDGMAAGTRMVAFYDVFGSNSVDLRVVPTSYAAFLQDGNRNARSAGTAIDTILAASEQGTATRQQDEVFYQLAGLSQAQLPGAMTALAGEVHAGLASIAPVAGRWVQRVVSGQLSGGGSGASNTDDPSRIAANRAFWFEMGNNRGHWDSDGTSSGFDTRRTQFAIGSDLASSADARLGIGFSHADSDLHGRQGSGSVKENIVFAYGQYRVSGYAIDGIAAYGHSTWRSSRSDPIGITGSLGTDQSGHSVMAGAGVRRTADIGGVPVEPFVRALYQHVTRGSASEGSASAAALELERYSASGVQTTIGVATRSAVSDPLADTLTWKLEAGVGQSMGNLLHSNVHASIAGVETRIKAPDVGRTVGEISASGTVRLGAQTYGYARMTGEVRSGQSEYGGDVGIRMAF